MQGIAGRFVSEHITELKRVVESYLAGALSHRKAQECAWRILDDWSEVSDLVKKERYAKGERIFWALVWELMTCADGKHWADGIPQRELACLLEALKTTGRLPKGQIARRP